MSLQTVEECDMLNDSKYRSYISQVEKVLRNFESTSEWADLISSLVKLNKVLLGHMKCPVIPKKVTIGKRLAQCLHPALPSGVHLKALETYDIIFKCIGPLRLVQDFFIYSAGLFPVMAHAAMSVKPVLLSIFENHFIALGNRIRPGLHGLLMGLLPGLDEGGEYYNRVSSLLGAFCSAVEPDFFYTCLWQCVCSGSSIRLPSVTFLLSQFNRKLSMEDQLHFMGLDIDLMVQALCNALQDSKILVQRSMLDFILLAFPMDNCQLTHSDLAKVVKAAVNVVLRRDMSLNRRLYLWLLGTPAQQARAAASENFSGSLHQSKFDAISTTSEMDLTYFHARSRNLLVGALKRKLHLDDCANCTKNCPEDPHMQILSTIRIIISLLDKLEIGPVIIEDILLEVFFCLYRECSAKHEGASDISSSAIKRKIIKESKEVEELVKIANLLFGSFESYFIWDFIGRRFSMSCCQMLEGFGHFCDSESMHSSADCEMGTVLDLCNIIEFMLELVNMDMHPETTTEYLAELLDEVVRATLPCVSTASDHELTTILTMCSRVLSHVQPSMAAASAHNDPDDKNSGGISFALDSPIGSRGLPGPGVITSTEMERDCCVGSNTILSGDDPVIGGPIEQDEIHLCSDRKTDNAYKNAVAMTPAGITAFCSVTGGECKLSAGDVVGEREHVNPVHEHDGEGVFLRAETVASSKLLDDTFKNARHCPTSKTAESCKSGSIPGAIIGQTGASSACDRIDRRCLMQQCLRTYLHLFHLIMESRFIEGEAISKHCMELLTLPSLPNRGRMRIYLGEDDYLLTDSSACSSDVDAMHDRLTEALRCVRVSTSTSSSDSKKLFAFACRLLLDFASFPLYCINYQAVINQVCHAGDDGSLPPWLQDLLTICCYMSDFQFHSCAVTTVLDLIVLTKSMQCETLNKTQLCSDSNDGHVSVVILPTLLPQHLQHINERTIFYQMTAHELWRHIGSDSPNQQQRMAELFHTLHQIAPSVWVCEDIIGRELVSEEEVVRLSAFRKFAALWHWTRSMTPYRAQGHVVRTFDRCMFTMLDGLMEDGCAVKSIAKTWLTHSVQRGDLSRVMCPILLMLLHPDTARVSIQHIHVQDAKPAGTLDSEKNSNPEANIYAISSDRGNVIFHVDKARSVSRCAGNLRDPKAMAFTISSERGQHHPASPPNYTYSDDDFAYEKVNPEDMKLRLNPFDSENPIDMFNLTACMPSCDELTREVTADLSTAIRLDKEICLKEGIFFDGGEDFEEVFEHSWNKEIGNKEHAAQEVVRELLDDVLSHVVQEISENRNLLQPASSTVDVHQMNYTLTVSDSAKSENASTSSSDISNHSGIPFISTSESRNTLEAVTSVHEMCVKDICGIHPLHMHLLLYTQPYDQSRILYALSTLHSVLRHCPQAVVVAMASTSVSAIGAPHLLQIQTLLARHRKSVFGHGFNGELQAEVLSTYRSTRFLEVIISLLLYFMRGYFPNLTTFHIQDSDLLGNSRVQNQAAKLLSTLLSEVLSIMRDSGQSFVLYISDLIGRCKLQKSLLHSLVANVYDMRTKFPVGCDSERSLTEAIVEFNCSVLDESHLEACQLSLMRFILVTIQVEDQICLRNPNVSVETKENSQVDILLDWDRIANGGPCALSDIRFHGSMPIVQQPMFLSSVLSVLSQWHLSHLHQHWVWLVTSALPYMGRSLPPMVLHVVLRICRNLELLFGHTQILDSDAVHTGATGQASRYLCSAHRLPPDYTVTLLEGLTSVCHHCLLDANSPVSTRQQSPASASTAAKESVGAGRLFGSLFSVFTPIIGSRELSRESDKPLPSPLQEARNSLLSHMTSILACLATIWGTIDVLEQQRVFSANGRTDQHWLPDIAVVGDTKVVRQHILEFINPLLMMYTSHIVMAFAITWNNIQVKDNATGRTACGRSSLRCSPPSLTSQCGTVLTPCRDQQLLVELMAAVKTLPLDSLITAVRNILKQSLNSELYRCMKSGPVDIPVLQLFCAYLKQLSVRQLVDSWPLLLAFLREGLTLNLHHSCIFTLLFILNDFVQRVPFMEEKKSQRELQDITQRLVEAVTAVASASLQQATWLSRNLSVKPRVFSDVDGAGKMDGSLGEDCVVEKVPQDRAAESVEDRAAGTKVSQQALMVLAQLVVPLLDVVYGGGEDRDKVTSLLTSVLSTVFPYLRHHSADNMPGIQAGSRFLSDISGYQHYRRAWRKEGFDLLMDPAFFQLDVQSLAYWKIVIDSLFTHDRSTMKDLLGRVAMTQTGSLNLFSSKEQEYEQRALMLKRLSFALYCSPLDQYQRYMPDIQERLADCMRLPQEPTVMSQVFLCFRVLILRMSPQQLTSLWPTIITEMVQVFLQMEQDLLPEIDGYKSQLNRVTGMESGWAVLGNGGSIHTHPSWLGLYLSVARLLDMCLLLPAVDVPHFQLYKWAFIGSVGNSEACNGGDTVRGGNAPRQENNVQFSPHVVRLTRLLNHKLKCEALVTHASQGRPALTVGHLRLLSDLQQFFNSLCFQPQKVNTYQPIHHQSPGHNAIRVNGGEECRLTSVHTNLHSSRLATDPSLQSTKQDHCPKSVHQSLEDILDMDFLEPIS